MYMKGIGVSQNPSAGFNLFSQSAKQGHAWGQFNLAMAYQLGDGVTKNDQEALKWFGLAAQQGHPKAQYQLAVFYGFGQGVPQDKIHGYIWARAAAVNGAKGAKKLRETLEKKMIDVQLRRAKALARSCIKNKFKTCYPNSI